MTTDDNRVRHLQNCCYLARFDSSRRFQDERTTRAVHDDGKRPDGLTLLPWNSRRSVTWDTLGNAYLQQSVITSASAAEIAAVRKRNKYSSLKGTHDFFRVALETLWPISVSTKKFLAHIGGRLTEVTTDPRETTFLFQRLSVIVQRFNAACLADTFAISKPAS